MRIDLFVTCLTDTLFPEVGRSTVAVLERLGHTLDFPPEQTCCGQMHLNSGYPREATKLVRRFADTFADSELVVCPSASCTGMVRHQYPRLAEAAGDAALLEEVRGIAERVVEFSELLVHRLGLEDVGASFAHRVTYHPTCHSLRELEVGDAPVRLLRAVRGLELIELPDAETCCGFGGTFAVKNPGVSTAMLSDKLRAVSATRAEVCVTCDSSCLMQIAGGLSRGRAGIRGMHLAEVLACTG